MKKILRFIVMDILENKTRLFFIVGILLLGILYFWIPIYKAHPKVLIYEVLNLSLVALFFSLIGALGIYFIKVKEAFIFILPIRGSIGVIIGILLSTVSFYLVARLLIRNIPILLNLWAGN
jgi:hypothetical protein